jgi:hypothetical protein
VTCRQWLPAVREYCGQPARRYPAGNWLCADHTPAKQAGRDEPPDPKEPK